MATRRTIVEINGKKYDANTGQIVADTPTATPVIDGFRAPVTAPAQTKPQTARTPNASKQLHQHPQKTKKLHPAAAKSTRSPKTVKSQTSQVSKPAQMNDVHRPAMLGQRANREERARQHQKSQSVQKFASTPEAVAVAQPAKEEPIAPAQPIAQATPVARPVQQTPPAPESPVAQSQPAAEADESMQKKGLVRGLVSRRPKLIPATMTAILLLGIGSYVAVRNIPNMALRIAAQRAGFSASLPGYSPSGYGFAGPVAYTEGVVELEYTSNSDDRTYRVIQRESSWDSQSLLDNFVSTTSNDYLTFQERGLTVYIYDTTNATWVDGGIWYTVEGNSLLTSEQLLKIAGSL